MLCRKELALYIVTVLIPLKWRLGMERQLWKAIVSVIEEISKPSISKKHHYSVTEILKVWFWAVVHDRPISWATEPLNWPIHDRRGRLPSGATVSRRLRSDAVVQTLRLLEERIVAPKRSSGMVWMIDGKPLTISGCSKDRQAGFGRAAGCKGKGYKLHALIGKDGEIAQWRVAPMNKDERVMARRMLRKCDVVGYVVGDSNYDSNKLHQVCDDNGNLQLVVPRRYGKNRGHGHRKQTAGRMRSKEILENPSPRFGNQLMKQREEIERYFGNLTSWGGGLTHLPPWIRTFRRVHRWVQSKLIANRLRQDLIR